MSMQHNFQETIYDVITGETTVRDFTEEETQERLAWLEQLKQENAVKEAKANAKSALLDKLGITAEEATLLLS